MTSTVEYPQAAVAVGPEARLRRARERDVPACLDVFYEAGEELHVRTNQPILPRNPASLGRLFGHLLETDPERSWVAESTDGQVVGFGLAHRRGSVWYLAFLYVRSDHQARGLGRRLLDACLGDDRVPARSEGAPTILGTAIEAIQPVSAGLYGSFGMLPRVPLYMTTGRRRDGMSLAPVHELAAEAFADLDRVDPAALGTGIDVIDRETLGYAHPQDHRLWSATGRVGYLFRDRRSGTTVGYGYVSSSGRIGPVAVLRERWMPEAIDHLFAAIEPPDAWLMFVPGPSAALVPLLRAGLRLDGNPAIFCSTAEGPAFGRYLAANFAIL